MLQKNSEGETKNGQNSIFFPFDLLLFLFLFLSFLLLLLRMLRASLGPRAAAASSSSTARLSSSSSQQALAPHQRRALSSSSSTLSIRRLCLRASAGGGDGISDLLARDKKVAGLEDFEEMPAEFVVDEEEDAQKKTTKKSNNKKASSATSSSPSSSSPSSSSSEIPTALDGTTPITCAQAIVAGEDALRSGDASLALKLFEAALDLPGSSAVRLAGSPREYGCASDAEAAAALYNMACAYVALGETGPALTCLEGAVEGGGREIAEAARGDPDLAALREGDRGGGGDLESALRKGMEARASPTVAGSGDGGPAGVLGGLAARLLRPGGGGVGGGGGGGGSGRDAGTVAGKSVGVLERIMRPW